MFLTHLESESNRIIGFELGADGYVTKPYSIKETILRIAAILRCTIPPTPDSNFEKYECNGNFLCIDEKAHKIFLNETTINLTTLEWKVLLFLIEHDGVALNRENILQKCLETRFNGYERTVDTHIRKIRAKLKSPGWITTIRGYGYAFAGKQILNKNVN